MTSTRKLGRFRHVEGRAQFDTAYDKALACWPAPPLPIELPTSFGTTRVNACGASTGTPIVLLHSMFMSSASWLPNVAALGERHPIFAVDTICDAGQSDQERVIGGGLELSSWLDDVLVGLDLDRVARVLGNGKLPPEPLYELMGSAFRDFKVVQPFPKRLGDDELRAIETPVLLLFGEHTPMCDPQRAVERARLLMPHVQAEVVPGTSHVPPIDDPPWVNRRILEFINGIDTNDEIAQD